MSGERRLAWVGRIAVISLPAEVDVANAGQVSADLAGAMSQGAALLIADMSATTFCDSAGVTALVRAAREARASGVSLRVAATAPAVTRVLAITGVDRLVGVYPSVAEALAEPEDSVAATAADPGQAAPSAGRGDAEGRAPQPG